MSKKKAVAAAPAPKATVSPALALRLLASLEKLAAHDTYETEYDGQMMTMCHDCGWLEKGVHNKGCDYLVAQAFIAEAYAAQPQPTPDDVARDAQIARYQNFVEDMCNETFDTWTTGYRMQQIALNIQAIDAARSAK